MFGTRWAIVHRDQTFSEPLTRALEDVPRMRRFLRFSSPRESFLSLFLHIVTSSARSLRTGDRFPEPFHRRFERRKSSIRERERERTMRKLGKIGWKKRIVEFLNRRDKGIEYRRRKILVSPFPSPRVYSTRTVPPTSPLLHRSLPFRNGR